MSSAFVERVHNFVELFNPHVRGYDLLHSDALFERRKDLFQALAPITQVEITDTKTGLCDTCPMSINGCDEQDVAQLDHLVRPHLARTLSRYGYNIQLLTVSEVRSLPASFYTELKNIMKEDSFLASNFYSWVHFD